MTIASAFEPKSWKWTSRRIRAPELVTVRDHDLGLISFERPARLRFDTGPNEAQRDCTLDHCSHLP